ncbi:Cytochrome P450 82A3 [Linum grandiflorum]
MEHQSSNSYAYMAIVAALPLLTLLLASFITRNIQPNQTTKFTKPPRRAPEPSGAWPLIGHLHLLSPSSQIPGCKILGALADKYGVVYSLQVGIHNLLVLSGWEVVKDCLTTKDRTMATRASIAVGKHLGYDNAVLGLAPYGPYWRHIRKMATVQLLSNHRIESMTNLRLSEVNQFLKEVYAESTAEAFFNMSQLLEQLAFNMALRMVVGKRFGREDYVDENSEVRRYKEAIEEAVRLSGVFVASDALPWLEWLDLGGHVGDMKRAFKIIDEVVGNWLEERLRTQQQGGDTQDFMDVMISSLGSDSDVASFSAHSKDTIVKATTL